MYNHSRISNTELIRINKERRTYVTDGISGLRNLGNSCYINSILQCLSSIDSFRTWLILDGYEKRLEKNKHNFKHESIVLNLSILFKQMWFDHSTIKPTSIKKIMGSICDTFKNNDQQDSHEFLNVLLDTIHDEVRAKVNMRFENVPNDVQKYMDFMVHYNTKATELEKQSYALELEEYRKSNRNIITIYNAYKYWENYVARTVTIPNIEKMGDEDLYKALKKKEDLEKSHSMITNLFTGLYYSTVICDECKNVTDTFEPFTILSLHIKESGTSTLEKSLSDFTQEETLTGDNQFYCTKCQKNVDAHKKMYIWEPPQVLIIQFKRFKNTQNFTVNFTNKIMTQIDFPLENLDVSPQLSDLHKVANTKYDLCATSSHTSRTCNMGHYVAYCKNSINNLWYEFDDDDVFSIAPDKVKDKIVTKDAYILFYVRQ